MADAGETMTSIVASVRQVEDIMADMDRASAEQSNGIDQINRAVADMDRDTQQNAAMFGESGAAANSLERQAGRLCGAIAVFKLTATTVGQVRCSTRHTAGERSSGTCSIAI
ncbi:MAG: methyl-accepting chemotaxis protein [Telluria sp.]